ncbi:hypothetical protein [Propionivibrio sp.]|uniref:hypothetical protein n=1 Tax=Propionivibrio sp. TaxID=2212460 RepID=UPI003BF1902F
MPEEAHGYWLSEAAKKYPAPTAKAQRSKGFAKKTFSNNGVPLRFLCPFAPLRARSLASGHGFMNFSQADQPLVTIPPLHRWIVGFVTN